MLKTVVAVGSDTLNLYGCHLASNNYDAESNYMTPDQIESKSNALKYLRNIERALKIRVEQCDSIVADMRRHEGACIVMGDMNDVCGSPCIRVLEDAGMKDAWWEGGFGYGATYHQPLAYRIDHVMYGVSCSRFQEVSKVSVSLKSLRLKGIKKVGAKGLSDHDALVAEFELR